MFFFSFVEKYTLKSDINPFLSPDKNSYQDDAFAFATWTILACGKIPSAPATNFKSVIRVERSIIRHFSFKPQNASMMDLFNTDFI